MPRRSSLLLLSRSWLPPVRKQKPMDGVHTVNSSVSRAEVAPQAAAAARAGNEYGEGASAGAQAFTSTADRATIQAEAVAKAHDPYASLDRRAFYRDEVPQAYKKPSVSFTRQATR
jgi:hypothetical protein